MKIYAKDPEEKKKFMLMAQKVGFTKEQSNFLQKVCFDCY